MFVNPTLTGKHAVRLWLLTRRFRALDKLVHDEGGGGLDLAEMGPADLDLAIVGVLRADLNDDPRKRTNCS